MNDLGAERALWPCVVVVQLGRRDVRVREPRQDSPLLGPPHWRLREHHVPSRCKPK
jgi:hypothetical protein